MKPETLKKIILLCEKSDEVEAKLILNALNRASEVRRQMREYDALSTIHSGDEVRIRNAKPKYLIGTRAIVLDVLASEGRFRIEFLPGADPRAIRRWGQVVTCSASMIEKN